MIELETLDWKLSTNTACVAENKTEPRERVKPNSNTFYSHLKPFPQFYLNSPPAPITPGWEGCVGLTELMSVPTAVVCV